jgi:hypothetical protein
VKRSFADIVREEAAENLRRLLLKLPEWADAASSLKIPSRLNLEQCSSSATAFYKAALAARIISETPAASSTLCDVSENLRSGATEGVRGKCPPVINAVADLTAGLGADCWAFAQVCGSVFYNEMNSELAAAVESNFLLLGVSNVVFRNCEVAPGRVGEILGGFAPDLIFMDPARRGDCGQKVFRLEDCQPNVLELKEELLSLCPNLLLKLSPMADITLLCRQLGPQVREVHCVGSGGECKELLLWLQRDWTGGVSICVSGDLSSNICLPEPGSDSASERLSTDFRPVLNFRPEEEAGAAVKFFTDGEELAGTAGLLFEPSAVTMKAGCFRLLCQRFGLTKLGRSTQLYVLRESGGALRRGCASESGTGAYGGSVVESGTEVYDESVTEVHDKSGTEAYDGLRRLGKLFRIKHIVPFSGASAAALGREFPCCEVSARNMPLSSDELRRKMKCKSGGSVHIFAAGVDFAGAAAGTVEGSAADSAAGGIGRGAAPKSARYLFVTERI